MTDKDILDHLQRLVTASAPDTTTAQIRRYMVDLQLPIGVTFTIDPAYVGDIRTALSQRILNHYGRLVAKSLEG